MEWKQSSLQIMKQTEFKKYILCNFVCSLFGTSLISSCEASDQSSFSWKNNKDKRCWCCFNWKGWTSVSYYIILFFKVGLSPSKNKNVLFILMKAHEKCFLFHLKSSFCSQDIYIFVFTFWLCRNNVLIRKIRLISKVMLWRHSLVKKLHKYCPISHEGKVTRQRNLVR